MDNNYPPSVIFSLTESGIVVNFNLPDNSLEKDAIDFAALIILVVGKNQELIDICINKAKTLKQHSEIIISTLSMYRGKTKARPAVSPLDALNF